MSIVTFIQNFIIIADRNLISATKVVVTRINMHILYSGIRILTAGLVLSFVSCQGGNTVTQETPTRGNIKILSDESFQPLIDTEVFTFTHLYNNAKIKVAYKPEFDIINDFMNDSVKVIVTSRKLSDDQIQYLRDTLVVARTTTFAYDALALVINKENKDSLFTFKSVKDIFLGNAVKWKELDPRSKLGDINVIFDNTKSGNIRYFREKFKLPQQLASNFYAVNSNPEVIDYVSKSPGALGIVSVNWISDKEDSLSISFTKKIKVAAVSLPYLDNDLFYMPVQGSIYDKTYPFVREVNICSRESFTGLGSGFVSFVSGEKGQRIILKSGLVPATMPIRIIQVKNE